MTPCEDKSCPVCYPNRLDEAATARKKREDDKHQCVEIWRFYQKKAESIVNVGDPVARNRRINAAYASLWLDDRRFQWAGLAAFASKQVGCGLLNAAEIMNSAHRKRRGYREDASSSTPPQPWPTHAMAGVAIQAQVPASGASTVYDMLAKGNMALFLDIWPLHMFYKDFGLQRLRECLPEREQLRGSALWQLRGKVEFGENFPEILNGFAAIERNDIAESVRLLAHHEQINILQRAMYEDFMFGSLMRSNQFVWASGLPTGLAQEIQLTLATECTLPGHEGKTESFSTARFANLANAEQRMEFVLRAARRFNELLHDPKHRLSVENSIRLMAPPR